LDDELKQYFGAGELSFQMEEAILSLAFEIALDAAGAFLRAFVLPLVMGMDPTATATTSAAGGGGTGAAAAPGGGRVANGDNRRGVGKPASWILTSLLSMLSRERPMECVALVMVPILSIGRGHAPPPLVLFFVDDDDDRHAVIVIIVVVVRAHPIPMQADLVRALGGGRAVPPGNLTARARGGAALPDGGGGGKGGVGGIVGADGGVAPPPSHTGGGMMWTESTMPLLTACLNRRPTLPDEVVAALVDEVSRRLLPSSNDGATSVMTTTTTTTTRSIQFSTLFHALVTKYGAQLKSVHRVEALLDSASRLGTFMSKSICLALKKLS
jgi:hypothetical protein